MNIHQVSVSYVQEQDRLMIRINGKEGGELRAWITRRMVLGLMPILNQTASDQMKKLAAPSGPAVTLDEQRQQLVKAFEKEASLRKGDFATPYQAQPGPSADLPTGPEPLLLTEIKVTLMGNGQLRLQMFEKLPDQETVRNFQVMMDAPLSNGFLNLLHQGLQQSRWLEAPRVSMAPTERLEPDAPDTEAAELAAEVSKPKYLN